MGTHPNTILMAVLKPDGTTRKTLQNMKGHNSYTIPHLGISSRFVIGWQSYYPIVMEADNDNELQIYADEGDIVVYGNLPSGGISWENLAEMKTDLEQWAIEMCKLYQCSYQIRVR